MKSLLQYAEGFSFAGTFLFSQKADADGVAAMLGLKDSFYINTDEGGFWMPGHSYDELMARIYSEWTVPMQATVPQAYPQGQKTLSFLTYLDKTGDH